MTNPPDFYSKPFFPMLRPRESHLGYAAATPLVKTARHSFIHPSGISSVLPIKAQGRPSPVLPLIDPWVWCTCPKTCKWPHAVWSFFSSSSGACLEEDGGQKGSGMSLGAATGSPGTCAGIHIREHPGHLAPRRWAAGHLRKKRCCSPSRAATEKQLPVAFPLPRAT